MKSKDVKVSAVILAAGSGSRMNSALTKQRMTILGKSVLKRCVDTFSECDKIDSIVVVCRSDECEWVAEELSGISKLSAIVAGGKNRAESAEIGFKIAEPSCDFVAIHDAARCLVTTDMISLVIDSAILHGAATAATPIVDTVKKVDSDNKISKTVPRDSLYLAQTPQVFLTSLYKKAFLLKKDEEIITDDNMLIELIGERVHVVDTGRENIKITTPNDVDYAEYILKKREAMVEYRIGHGYDVHRFAEDRELILGGVRIPSTLGLLGHSDADVLTHAIMDSLLGAAGLGDIGRHFPDKSDEYKGISSLVLLERVNSLLKSNGYTVVNVDATVVMQQPKLAPYIEEMRSNIAKILEIDQGRINVKATTEEGLGFTGSGEGAAAHSVAMIKIKG